MAALHNSTGEWVSTNNKISQCQKMWSFTVQEAWGSPQKTHLYFQQWFGEIIFHQSDTLFWINFNWGWYSRSIWLLRDLTGSLRFKCSNCKCASKRNSTAILKNWQHLMKTTAFLEKSWSQLLLTLLLTFPVPCSFLGTWLSSSLILSISARECRLY